MVKKEHRVVEIQNVKRPIWSSFLQSRLQHIFQRIQNCIKNRPWAGRADGVLWKAWKQTQEQTEASPAGGRAIEGWTSHCSCWKSPRGSMGFKSVQRTQDGPLISESLPRKMRPHRHRWTLFQWGTWEGSQAICDLQNFIFYKSSCF